ncbi:hypothetical protein D3C79_1008770 [compost metagenome]
MVGMAVTAAAGTTMIGVDATTTAAVEVTITAGAIITVAVITTAGATTARLMH